MFTRFPQVRVEPGGGCEEASGFGARRVEVGHFQPGEEAPLLGDDVQE